MKLLIVILGLIIATSCTAQPRLEVVEVVDWGLVVPDTPPGHTAKLTRDVVIYNRGSANLDIHNVRPGCGCTTAPLDESTVAPGDSTIMRVTLNVPVSNGPVHKKITIESNGVDSMHVVHLKANVQRPLQASSSFIPFDRGYVGQQINGAVTFSAYGDEPIVIDAKSITPGVEFLSPLPATIQPNTSYDLVVGFTPQNSGRFTVEVEVSSSLKNYDSFVFRGYGNASDSK